MIINRITVIAQWGQDSALARMHIDETKRFASPLLNQELAHLSIYVWHDGTDRARV